MRAINGAEERKMKRKKSPRISCKKKKLSWANSTGGMQKIADEICMRGDRQAGKTGKDKVDISL